MTTIERLVHRAGGLLHKHDLVAAGATDRHLTAAVRRGHVRRPRRGWYSTWPPDDARFVAVAVGGRLTGASALHALGGWMWRRPPVTVSVPRGASRLRRRRGVRVVWDDVELSGRGTTWSVAPADALARMIDELSFEDAVAVATWCVRQGLVARADLPGVLASRRRDAAGLADWVDPACESFLEVVGAVRLRRRGHGLELQRRLPNGQRIDVTIDGLVALELDGRATHAGSFVADRAKDLVILGESLVPVRVPFDLVRDAWDDVCAAVDAVLRDHARCGASDLPRGGRRTLGGARAPVDKSSSWRVLGPRGRRPWRLGRARRPRGRVADGARARRGPDEGEWGHGRGQRRPGADGQRPGS